MPRDGWGLTEQQLLTQNLPRGRCHPMYKTPEIAHGKLNMLVQQLIGLHLCHMAGSGCIVMDPQAVCPPVLQCLHGGMRPADHQLADHICYLLLERLP